MDDINKQIINKLNKNLDQQNILRTEINKLPKGKIHHAVRGNKEYFYRTYREGNEVRNIYVGRIDVVDIDKILDNQVKREKMLLELKELENEEKELRRLVKVLKINYVRTVYSIYEIKKLLKPIYKKYDLDNIYLFGSYSRNEAKKNSDIDLIVNLEADKRFKFEEDVKKILKKDVDVLYNGDTFYSLFLENIYKDAIKL